MIEMGKKYRTRDGRAVRVLCIDGPSADYPVVAVIGDRYGHWRPDDFTSDGCNVSGQEQPNDLIEVATEHTRWHIVSEHLGYATKEEALAAARDFYNGRPVAVASVTFRTGDGL